MPGIIKNVLNSVYAAATAVAVMYMIPVDLNAATPRTVKKIIVIEAADTAVPPSMALAVGSVESGFRDDYESATGTRGVMQITPEIARQYGVNPDELLEARKNVRLGLQILDQYFRESSHNWQTALSRYAAAMPGGYKPAPFARKVLRLERRFAEEIVTRKALERRKREVLNLPQEGQLFSETMDDKERGLGRRDNPHHERLQGHHSSAVHCATNLNRKVYNLSNNMQFQLAHRSLDDFSAGRIPNRLMKPRSERRNNQ